MVHTCFFTRHCAFKAYACVYACVPVCTQSLRPPCCWQFLQCVLTVCTSLSDQYRTFELLLTIPEIVVHVTMCVYYHYVRYTKTLEARLTGHRWCICCVCLTVATLFSETAAWEMGVSVPAHGTSRALLTPYSS